jgi:hypothetical protein
MLNQALTSFFQPKMEQNEPEKKIPSTAAKAINRSANESDSIHFKAQSAFFLMAGKTFQWHVNNYLFLLHLLHRYQSISE